MKTGDLTRFDPPYPMRSVGPEVIAIVGMQAREARELALAAEAVGLAVRPLAFGSPLAEAALAAHGPGSVHLPLAIVAGRYSLQRPALEAVLECIEALRGSHQRLPAACAVLASTAAHAEREQFPVAEWRANHPDPATTAHLIRREIGQRPNSSLEKGST